MLFNQDSEWSFYLVCFLLTFCSVMAIMFVPYNASNRKRYAFIKTVRTISLYMLLPLFALLIIMQIYGFVTGSFITMEKSLWRIIFLIGGGIGYYLVKQKLLKDATEAIQNFRRGSFNSGKFQKLFGKCRNYFVLLLVLCLGILFGQYLFIA